MQKLNLWTDALKNQQKNVVNDESFFERVTIEILVTIAKGGCPKKREKYKEKGEVIHTYGEGKRKNK